MNRYRTVHSVGQAVCRRSRVRQRTAEKNALKTLWNRIGRQKKGIDTPVKLSTTPQKRHGAHKRSVRRGDLRVFLHVTPSSETCDCSQASTCRVFASTDWIKSRMAGSLAVW